MSWRAAWRRLSLGLPTVLGLARKGYFIPYRYAADTTVSALGRRYGGCMPLIVAGEASMREVLAAMRRLTGDLAAIGGDEPPAPRWNQTWFPRLDAAAAYTLVRTRRPRRIVEVGAGHSTRFFARSIADGGLTTRLTAVDPAPRAVLRGLRVELVEKTIQAAGLDHFAGLAGGDMVSIDSSHILMPGSDVDWLLGDVLPNLSRGVLVHIHDVFLPDAYPSAWAWRGYNEQAAVAVMLQAGGWRVLWSSHHVATAMQPDWRATLVERLPLVAGAVEGSLWLEKLGRDDG